VRGRRRHQKDLEGRSAEVLPDEPVLIGKVLPRVGSPHDGRWKPDPPGMVDFLGPIHGERLVFFKKLNESLAFASGSLATRVVACGGFPLLYVATMDAKATRLVGCCYWRATRIWYYTFVDPPLATQEPFARTEEPTTAAQIVWDELRGYGRRK
jgi:hypothetical protein